MRDVGEGKLEVFQDTPEIHVESFNIVRVMSLFVSLGGSVLLLLPSRSWS